MKLTSLSRLLFSVLALQVLCSRVNGNNNGCDESEIYDTFIVYGFDGEIEDATQFAAPMSSDDPRNTYAFRERAYNYYLDEYDLNFENISNPGIQEASNVPGIAVFPLRLTEDIPYSILAYIS